MRTIFKDKTNSGDMLSPAFINNQSRSAMQNIKSGNGLMVNQVGDDLLINQIPQRRLLPFVIPCVAFLPPIPTSGFRYVFWVDANNVIDGVTGTGDNQIWVAYYGQEEYYPQQKYTSLSGIPLN